MRALIQNRNGQPHSVSATLAALGFTQLGYELAPFTVEEIDRTAFRREDVVVGGVGTYTRVFAQLGVVCESVSYPESLSGFLGRTIRSIQLRELEDIVGKAPAFIKPAQDDKTFTGFVCKDRWDPRLAGLSGETELLCAEVVNFQAEYRVYVLEGKIQNISRYCGIVDAQPDVRLVRAMIESYVGAPISYALDVGRDDCDATLLVEINEPLALSNYGLAPTLQAKMIAARWHEIMGNPIAANEAAQTVDSPVMLMEW